MTKQEIIESYVELFSKFHDLFEMVQRFSKEQKEITETVESFGDEIREFKEMEILRKFEADTIN